MALFFESRDYQTVARWQGIMLTCGLHPEIREYTGNAYHGGDKESDAIARKLAHNSKGLMGIAVPSDEFERVCDAWVAVRNKYPDWGVFDSEERQQAREALFASMVQLKGNEL